MCAQKKRLIETVASSTNNICFGWEMEKKANFLLRTLIYAPNDLPPLTCISQTLLIALVSLGDLCKEEQQIHAKIPSYPSQYKNSYSYEKNKFHLAVIIQIYSSIYFLNNITNGE